jgi:hypothetical protein
MKTQYGLYLAAALLALNVVAPEAMAQTPADAGSARRLLSLRDGSLYNGELVEKVPGDHITLKLVTGEIRRFEWREIAEVPPPEPATPSPPGATPAAPTPPASPPRTINAPPASVALRNGTVVQLQTDDPEAALYRQAGVSMVSGGRYVGMREFWNKVCKSPCGQSVDPDGLYSIRGINVAPSPAFMLPRLSFVSIDATTAPGGPKVAGGVFTTLGAVGAGAGLFIAALGAASPSSWPAGQKQSWEIGGAIGLGVGIAVLVGGFSLLAQEPTKVRINEQEIAQFSLRRLGPLYVSAQGLRF